MTLPEDIYTQRILELAASIPRTARLSLPEASATAHSKLCGSTVTVDLSMDGGVVTEYGQTVKACLLGQSAASVMGREIIGSSAEELQAVGAAMRKMLKQGGPPPRGKWADLAVLEPVRDYRARHASTLLVFDAVEDAIRQIEAKRAREKGEAKADQASLLERREPAKEEHSMEKAKGNDRCWLDPASVMSRVGSIYPKPFDAPLAGREKRALGDPLGLTQFGVNLTTLAPGAWSSQRHWHVHEDEFVYVVEGELTLVTDEGETVLREGMAAGFPAGKPDGHHLINRGDKPVRYLEVGTRCATEEAHYSDIDMVGRKEGGRFVFTHKNGEPYP